MIYFWEKISNIWFEKRVPNFSRKKFPLFFSGKKFPIFREKKFPIFSRKKVFDFSGKNSRFFAGKKVPDFSGKRVSDYFPKKVWKVDWWSGWGTRGWCTLLRICILRRNANDEWKNITTKVILVITYSEANKRKSNTLCCKKATCIVEIERYHCCHGSVQDHGGWEFEGQIIRWSPWPHLEENKSENGLHVMQPWIVNTSHET
jgi:hypothetical protein